MKPRQDPDDDERTGSERMSLVQLFVPTEVAHDTVHELGELGDVQFKDVRRPCLFTLHTLAFLQTLPEFH